MTAEARNEEADQASIAFHIALTQIGASTVQDALRLWQGVPPTATASQSAAWLKRAVFLVMSRRSMSRDLAMAYYRLVRALRTGSTIADPRHPEPPYVTLSLLRSEFAALAGNPDSAASTEAPAASDGSPEREGDDDEIPVEELPDLGTKLTRLEQLARQEGTIVIDALGARSQSNNIKQIDTTQPADDVDAQREQVHRQAGARQASTTERVAMDGARSTLWTLADSDEKCIGYVRLSRTGTPCGWCAMLISRGPVYKSKASATYKGAASYEDGDKYHDNCHCYAMPVFGFEQFEQGALYALNRLYAEQWPVVTRGLSGNAAISAWRRFIRQQLKDQASESNPPTTAQEA